MEDLGLASHGPQIALFLIQPNKWKRGVLLDIVLDVFRIDFKTYVREGFK